MVSHRERETDFGIVKLTRCCRSTTKDNDVDGEKAIDQPEKRDIHGNAIMSLEPRNDAPGAINNKSFEGAIGNWIEQGVADGTLDTSAASFGEVNAQGLPDW